MLNYNHLHYFHVAASEGSLARAAEKLGVTQPTVSEQIRSLERSLGVQLFERSPAGLKLTEAGRRAYEHTTQMFRAGERLAHALVAGAATARVLRVAVTPAALRALPGERVATIFGGAAPVHLSVADAAELVRLVRGHTVDLAVTVGEPTSLDGLRVTALDRPALVAVAGAAMPIDEGWRDVPALLPPATSPFRAEIDDFLRERSLVPAVIGETDEPSVVLAAAAAGIAVGFIARDLAEPARRAGDVRLVGKLAPSRLALHAISGDGELALEAIERLRAPANELAKLATAG